MSNPTDRTNVSLMALDERLKDYIEKMHPSTPVATDEGVRQQTALWNAFRFVLGKTDGEFVAVYARLLEHILAHRKTVFHERYVYRFFEHLRLSPTDRRNFERMLNLVLVTCDPKTRRLSLRQVNLHASLAGFADNALQQRVIGFYSV